ncbi:helix-turn-helix transcriptional regulator [Methylobacterium organophilum]|jgi:transcriptional regulator with XRE-family HTH domain|uniref:helix-turn-helix domain-containing protein n=1 Tax=Methylobacterium organophilum TaxID=410 RepID=UPI0019D0BB27|nr:helix-turn-helix transcriptional regulator [Methylobacterium organophilum]MBN6820679.1 helix-turn-helix transcriptional regulator [Methylobacterium organophilum]
MPRSISDIDRRIAGRIREFRKAAGLSQSQLGAAIGVTFQQCQKYELGSNKITAGRLQLVAEALGVQPADFFTEVEPVAPRLPTVREAQEALQAAALMLADAQARASEAVALAEAA